MQDRLKEIEGTLARTKERKNTILYKLAKRRQEEERLALLGVQRLPTNPYEVDDVKLVKYILFKLKQEIGDKTAHLRDSNLLSIDRDGEAIVRVRNDEINKLLVRKTKWEARLATLEGKEPHYPVSRKHFFGCAKDLPEAKKGSKREREHEGGNSEPDDGTSSSGSESIPNEEYMHGREYQFSIEWLGCADADKTLLPAERAAEQKSRKQNCGRPSQSTETNLILSYCTDGKICIPSEDEVKKSLLENRKRDLQQRLSSLREKE